MAGHILSVFLEEPIEFPYIALIVSGGTSSIFRVDGFGQFSLLGRTRDDAAGEAFDKVAKLLALPYPGGPHVAAAAENGNGKAIFFPRAWLDEGSLDFSFSGVKTAVLNHCIQCRQHNLEPDIADVCASFQEAVFEVLVGKTLKAADDNNIQRIVLGGGVSANKKLRENFALRCQKQGYSFHVPHPKFCTDNGAMIALAGYHKFQLQGRMAYDEDVYSRSILG